LEFYIQGLALSIPSVSSVIAEESTFPYPWEGAFIFFTFFRELYGFILKCANLVEDEINTAMVE